MLIHCPNCNTEYDCAPGKYECECGAKFTLSADGLISIRDSASRDTTINEQTVNLDIDKTIPPRQYHEDNPDLDMTMPGQRDRKPDGRFSAGDLILGRYKVLSELGQGGMGVVYKCFDEIGGIVIALKALPPELSHNTMEMEDVKENFQLIAKLVHQNVAISKNLEKDSTTGNYYLIMECVEGEDLRRWIRQKRKEGSLTIETILPVIRQVAAALDYAHEQKIIHRDIKPGNIMIDSAGHVKVLDFGLAAQIHTSMTRVSMAYHGTSGTAPYMAPEQWRGRAQGAPADQYALAVMTYEMLAGHLPFESTDASVLREAVLNEMVDPISGIPAYAQQALNRALSKNPTDRFRTCSDFVTAFCLECILLGSENTSETKQKKELNSNIGDSWSQLRPSEKPKAEQPVANAVATKKDKMLTPSRKNKKTLIAVAGVAVMTGIILIIALGGNSGSAATEHQGNATKQKTKLSKRIQEDIAKGFVFSEDGKTLLKAPRTITKYDIPSGVTRLADSAFLDCDLLTSVTIPNSVRYIGEKDFPDSIDNASSRQLDIDRSYNIIGLNTGNPHNKHPGAFEGCSALTSVIIPNSVEWIGDHTFEDCTALTSVTIQEGDRKCYIGYYAFSYCTALVSITIPNRVYGTDEKAFCGCTSLRNVTLSHNMSVIDRGAFEGCKELESITIPDSVTSIQASAFYNCTALKNVTFPKRYFNIEGNAFGNCKSLMRVDLPKDTYVEKYAFQGAGCE